MDEARGGGIEGQSLQTDRTESGRVGFPFVIDAYKPLPPPMLLASIGWIGPAYWRAESVGMLSLPRADRACHSQDYSNVRGSGKVQCLTLGVRETACGHRLNLAMVGYGFPELTQRRVQYLSPPLVLDENWGAPPCCRKTGRDGARQLYIGVNFG